MGCGIVERRRAVLVIDRVQVGAGCDQRGGGFAIAFGGRGIEGRRPAAILFVEGSFARDQQAHYVDIPARGCQVQGGTAGPVGSLDVGSMIEQHGGNHGLTLHGRVMQGCR